jgi:hypothetical protein
MELLKLRPPAFGIAAPGIYVLDDAGGAIYAGPFESEIAAIAWIEATAPARAASRRSDDPRDRASLGQGRAKALEGLVSSPSSRSRS